MRFSIAAIAVTSISFSHAFVARGPIHPKTPFGERSSTTSLYSNQCSDGFDLDTALFCGGLAFDAYVEPPTNSSRWERGVSSDERIWLPRSAIVHCVSILHFISRHLTSTFSPSTQKLYSPKE